MYLTNLAKLRQENKLTHAGLEKNAKVSYNTIIKLETGGIKDPRISTMVKIANAFEISIDTLLASI